MRFETDPKYLTVTLKFDSTEEYEDFLHSLLKGLSSEVLKKLKESTKAK